MLNLNEDIKRIYLIGIGGIGVSAIAEILLNSDYIISGSDLKRTFNTQKLEQLGATIYYQQDGAHINETIDLVVYSSAISPENPEYKKAVELNIPMLNRAEMLGNIMASYKESIAVSGAHGKTTTTSMLSLMLDHAMLQPTIMIGGNVKEFNGNAKVSEGDILITEACEYKDNFLHFKPTTSIVLNIDEDHLDYFEDLDQIVDSFTKFIKLLPANGKAIINIDDFDAKKLLPHVEANLLTFGITQDADYMAKNIVFSEDGTSKFDVYLRDEFLFRCSLSIPGTHNIYNSLAAITGAHAIGVSTEVMQSTLKGFSGADRRFQHKGSFKEATVIDDYAHHPTEIKATLSAAKKLTHNRITCIFQPHTYTRTEELLHEFSTSFKDADLTIITDIYAAREVDSGRIHSKDLANLIKKEGQAVKYLATFEEIVAFLKDYTEPGDIIFTMGAGNIYQVGEIITESNSL
ncbi:MAG: UDP-N-acetylmuramate--L-alanine ligase [Clostridia bacterium]|nr:UDP-N-acetylmuramate--L-alanine ligase [Clostridia bacterium]